jgi:hypothetical protein
MMSSTVPKSDPWSRLNSLTTRLAAIERVSQTAQWITADVPADEATGSTTYVDLATPGPSVTVNIGAGGQVRISVNAVVSIPGGTGGTQQSAGFVGIFMDGTLFADEVVYFSNTVVGATPVGMAGNNSSTWLFSEIPPGEHTFSMKYRMVGPGTVNFSDRLLQVRPI